MSSLLELLKHLPSAVRRRILLSSRDKTARRQNPQDSVLHCQCHEGLTFQSSCFRPRSDSSSLEKGPSLYSMSRTPVCSLALRTKHIGPANNTSLCHCPLVDRC